MKKWESLGVDCINFILNANEVVPQEQVMASLIAEHRHILIAADTDDGDVEVLFLLRVDLAAPTGKDAPRHLQIGFAGAHYRRDIAAPSQDARTQ